MRNLIFILALGISINAHASAGRDVQADTLHATGGAVMAVPSTGANVVSDTATQTITNKTLTAPVINSPTGIVKGDVGLGNVDNTSDATKNAATATLTNKILTSPVINTPTGIVKGDVGLGNVDNTSDATKNAAAVTLTNKTIDYNSNTILNLPSASPSLNGGSGAAQSVTAAGGVSLSSIQFSNVAWIIGSPGAVTVTATPSITVGTSDGQTLSVIGTSATNTVRLQDKTNLASSGLSLNGDFIGGKDSVLNLRWDATQSLWIEQSRR